MLHQKVNSAIYLLKAFKSHVFLRKNGQKDARSSKNKNLDIPLISASSGSFPWARLQPLPSLASVQGLQLALFPLESRGLRFNQLGSLLRKHVIGNRISQINEDL